MTSDQSLVALRKLAQEQDNAVASLVLDILETAYPSTPEGFKQAIDDGMRKCAELVQSHKEKFSSLEFPRPRLDPYDPLYPYHNTHYSRLLNQAGVVGQVWPGTIGGIPNSPSPIASMAVLGLLGAGAGNVAGRVADRIVGNEDGQLKRRFSLYGGAAGMVPGMLSAAINVAAGDSPFTGQAMSVPMRKMSLFEYQPNTVIPVEKVHEMVWNDPFVSSNLPPTLAAATSAIVEGAGRIGNRQSETPFITPSDVGRMAVGMGSGYASGWIAGKALGALFGVSDKSQEILRRSGAAAGLLRTIIPPVFGF